MNAETARIALVLGNAIVSLGPIDMICGMRAAWTLALACSRKAGGQDIDTAAVCLMEIAGWNEDAAIAAIRNAGAKWREHHAAKVRVTQDGSVS